MLVDAFAVKVRCNFWEKLQEKAVNSNSTTISGQKMPKNSKKSETTTFFDHKKIEMFKFSSVPFFYDDSAFLSSTLFVCTTCQVNLRRHLAKSFTDLSTVMDVRK